MSSISAPARASLPAEFSHFVIVSLLALTSTAASAQTPPPADEAYCRALKQIAEGAAKDFADYAVEPPVDGQWQTSIALPEQEHCYISRTKRISFICETRTFESKAEADALATKTFERASKCLGKLWDRNTKLSEFFSALNDDEHGRTVIVSVASPVSPFPEFFVQTQIARSNQQALEPEAKEADNFKQESYCDDLKRVVDSGKHEFAALIANSTPERMGTRIHWESAIQIPGWSSCWVHGDPGKSACRYLSCSAGPFVDQAEASNAMDRNAADAQACLGSSWTLGRTRATDGTLNLRLIGAADDPYVVFRPSKSLYTEAWNLSLDVDLNVESCR